MRIRREANPRFDILTPRGPHRFSRPTLRRPLPSIMPLPLLYHVYPL